MENPFIFILVPMFMKIGITIEPYQGISPGDLLGFAKAISPDHVEINVRIIPEAKGFIENLGGKMTTTFHMPIYGVEDYDPGTTSKKNSEKMEKVISFINKNKDDLNMLYTLSHPPENEDSTFEKMMERLQQVETPIVLENIIGQKDEVFMDFYFKAKKILGKQLAGHTIDAAHRLLTYQEKWLDIPEKLLKEIVYVHLQDSSGMKDDHLPLGHGVMDYNAFLQLLKDNNFTGVINQEIKPKGLDLESIMDSCLYCVKPFHKMRYLRLKTRYAILRPILRNKINKAAKQAKNK